MQINDPAEPPLSPFPILVQTVGTGGPGNPVWEALAFACHEVRPRILVQFCSEQTARETVPRFQDGLGDFPVECRPPVISSAPDDVERLTLEYGEQIDRLRAEFPDAAIHADFTSGTKPMSAALVAVAIARRLPFVCYATGPRDATGRATCTTRLQQLSTGTLVAERLLDELGRLFNLGQFDAVARQAEELERDLSHDALRARASTLAFLAGAYAKWDRFDWKGAAADLRRLTNLEKRTGNFSRSNWPLEDLRAQMDHLNRCREQSISRDRQADLLANIDRRIAAGQADDAISRLYRLTELLLQDRFAARLPTLVTDAKNPTSKVPVDTLKQQVPKAFDSIAKRKCSDWDTWDLGLREVMEVLYRAGDAVGVRMWMDYTGGTGEFNPKTNGQFCNRLNVRNGSWLAHGSKACDMDSASALHQDVGNYLKLHFETPAIDDLPAGQLEDYLSRATFSKCPWVTVDGR